MTEYGRTFLKLGVIAGLISCAAQIFPTGDMHGKYLAKHQPAAIAGMEGLFHSEKGAALVVMGQPDFEHEKIDNPIAVNKVLSFLIYGTTVAEVQGLDQTPRDQWPTTLPLLFYSYHIMAGLGHLLRRSDGLGRTAVVARQALCVTLDSMADSAELSAALHRQHRRLDVRGDRPSALAGVWPDPHLRRLLARTLARAPASLPCWDSSACTRCCPFSGSCWSTTSSKRDRRRLA